LYHNAGRLCSKDELWQAVWPEYEEGLADYPIHKLISVLAPVVPLQACWAPTS
jgi:DNA-binding winged helix-turn-helix (wHTH) protein